MFYHLKCLKCGHLIQVASNAVGEDNPDGGPCLDSSCTGTYAYRRYGPRAANANDPVTTVNPNAEGQYSARIAGIKSRSMLKRKAAPPSDDDNDDGLGARPSELGDEYAPPPRHSVEQRLTLADYSEPPQSSFQHYSLMMLEATRTGTLLARSSPIHRVTAGAIRKGGKSVMGGSSAADVAAAAGYMLAPPTLAGGKRAGVAWEWLHLVARCVGGGSVSHNFIAGSFSANTYMEVIEHFLTGRTDLAVRITSFGRHHLVALWIRYEIFRVVNRKDGKPGVERKWEQMINAQTIAFSKYDSDKLVASLRAELRV